MGSSEWMHAFFDMRGLSKPDGRWLYAYRLTLQEYQSLKSIIHEAATVTPMSLLARRNQRFAALFVLYAAEWWRREYDGGAWKWAPIFASLGLRKDDLSPNERTGLVLTGFAFWGHKTSGDGKKYFGSVVAHGGLPLKLIGHGGSRLNVIMGAVLRQANRYGWAEAQIAEAVSDHFDSVADSLRHEEIYLLLARMITATLELKQRHQLSGLADPFGYLDSHEPNWRDHYPLQIDDAAAGQLLSALVQAASQTTAEDGLNAVFTVERLIQSSGNGAWRLQSRIVFPSTASADALARQCGLADVSVVPRYFDIDATVGERRAIASGRLLLGSAEATVALGVGRHTWEGNDACQEHVLHLRSAGSDLNEGGASMLGGDTLVGVDGPWIFVDEGCYLRLAGVGDVRIPDKTAVVAVRNGETIQPLDSSEADPCYLGLLAIDDSLKFELWQVAASVRIIGADDSWLVKLAQTRTQAGGLILEGRRTALQTRPWPLYRGCPRLIRFDENGGRAILRSGLRWYAAGTKTPVDPSTYSGPADLQVFDEDERIGRFRLVIISEHAREQYVSGGLGEPAEVTLHGWGFSDIAIDASELVQGRVSSSTHGQVIRLDTHGTPPKDVHMFLRWAKSPQELRVSLPVPVSGGRAFDSEGKALASGNVVSLRHASGVRILIFDQNPNQPKKYEVELELQGDSGLKRSGAAISNRGIPIIKGFAELRVLDLYNEIRTLLGLTNELDASVKLTLKVGGKPDFFMSISRYDAALKRTIMGVSLADDDMKQFGIEQLAKCEVLARPILDPEAESTLLPSIKSEGAPSGVWSTEGLSLASAPWLLFPANSSSIEFRPLCINGGCDTAESNGECVPPALQRVCSLGSAIKLRDAERRLEAIEAALNSMAENFEHDSWRLLDHLWSSFGALPLCSIDTFKVLATVPEVVVAMLVRSERPGGQLSEHVARLKHELGLALELVGITYWRRTVSRFKDYWTAKVGEDVASVSFPLIVRERLVGIAEAFPALALTMHWLRFEFLNEPSDELLKMQRGLEKDPSIHLEWLWNGSDCLHQRLLLRVHAEDTDWPEPRFFKARALRALVQEIQKSIGSPSQDFQNLLEKFFWSRSDDFKLSVTNIPVLCAIWSALDLPLDWWRDPSNRLALQRIRAFDPPWFQSAYRHGFAACIGLEMIRTQVTTSSNGVAADRGHRTHRVAAGSVTRRRVRMN